MLSTSLSDSGDVTLSDDDEASSGDDVPGSPWNRKTLQLIVSVYPWYQNTGYEPFELADIPIQLNG